jgi:hypothetical protein
MAWAVWRRCTDFKLDSCWAIEDKGYRAILLRWQEGGGLVMTGRDVLLFLSERALQRWLRRVRYRQMTDLDWLGGARFKGLYRASWSDQNGTAAMLKLSSSYLLTVTEAEPQYLLDEVVTVTWPG